VIVEQVARIASERQVPRAQVALAWVASRPGITAPIIGATNLSTSARLSPRSTLS